MRFIVITDVHANLPALDAALRAIHREGYDLLIHTGDAIGTGPFPAECLDRLRHTPRIRFVMGNHDAWFAGGLPHPAPPEMSPEEVHHHHWTHAQLDPDLRAEVAAWPFRTEVGAHGFTATFQHYALDRSGRDWVPIIREPTPADLDRLFGADPGSLVFYGHHHPAADATGRARYINPGSLGCHVRPEARYTVVEFPPAGPVVRHEAVPYDDGELRAAFVARDVPARAQLSRLFFGGRFRW